MRLLSCFSLLLLLPLLSHALPQPQTGADAGVSADDITKKSGSSYTQENIDSSNDLIKELFGSQGNSLNENYNPPKKENIKVNTASDECAFFKEDGFECVPYFQCDEFGEIITDGGPGLIDLRGNFGLEIKLDPDNSKCPGDLEVCCRDPEYTEPIKPKPLPYKSRCGTRNIDGIGVRISNNDKYAANAQFGEFPHMCAVLEEKLINGDKKNLFVSGASLIAPGIVMTAAHSVYNYTLPNANPIKVRCGEWDTQKTNEPAEHQDRYVSNINVHPGFSQTNVSNNIALLFVQEDFIMSAHIDIICLPNFNEMQESYKHEECIATGWGKDRFDSSGEYQTILKKVELDVVDPYQCQSQLQQTRLGSRFKLDPTFMCAGGSADVDTCKGDGGGPLICPTGRNNGYGPQYVQAGIVAWGIGCGEIDIPGVYTDVADMLCFIDWATRCEKGDTDHFEQDIKGCRHWATREVNRLREAKKSYNEQANETSSLRLKGTFERRARKHDAVIKSFKKAIKKCNLNIQDEIQNDDFIDYDDNLDVSGYKRIYESLADKKDLLEDGINERKGSR